MTPEQLKNASRRFWSRVNTQGDCWLWTGGCTTAGYGVISIGNKHQYAHRVAWMYTYGDPGELLVLHRCDTPACVRPDHLFIGTDLDNTADRIAKGRPHGRHIYPEKFPTGERVHTAKLTREQVRVIRSLHENRHVRIRQLAREYGVNRTSIKAIVTGRSWKENT